MEGVLSKGVLSEAVMSKGVLPSIKQLCMVRVCMWYEDKIPANKIPTTGFRCGCPDFLDLYMHAWFGPMVHVYIHTYILSSCRAA